MATNQRMHALIGAATLGVLVVAATGPANPLQASVTTVEDRDDRKAKARAALE
jgi:hypothetical protein